MMKEMCGGNTHNALKFITLVIILHSLVQINYSFDELFFSKVFCQISVVKKKVCYRYAHIV